MSLTYGFYNSVNHDRLYTAEQFATLFDGVINDGVFGSVGNHFKVRWVEGMTIVVGSGRAWFEHTWTLNDSDFRLTIDSADLFYPRYDCVVLETNHGISARANTLKIIKGTPATSPSYPRLIQNTDHYQHPLAYIYIRPAVLSINQDDITSVIGTSACPFATSIMQQTNVDELYNNWNQQWRTWLTTTTTSEQAEIDAWEEQTRTDFLTWETAAKNQFDSWYNAIKDTLGNTGAELVDGVATLINKVNNIITSRVYTLTSSAWATPSEQSYPFEQTITVQGMTASEEPIFEWGEPDTVTHDTMKAYNKSKGYVDRWITQDGSIKFQCWNKKPTVDLKIRIRRFAL